MDATVPWRVRDGLLPVLCGFVALILTGTVILGLYAVQRGMALPTRPPALVSQLVPMIFYVAVLAALWFFIIHRYHAPWSLLGLRLPRRRAAVPVLLLCMLLLLGTLVLILGTHLMLDITGRAAPIIVTSGMPPVSSPLFPAILIETVLLAPVTDELLFRGALYQALRQRVGTVVATVGSALLFTLAHRQPGLVPETLLLGVVLAMAFEQAESLYPSIVINAVYNGAIVLVALQG